MENEVRNDPHQMTGSVINLAAALALLDGDRLPPRKSSRESWTTHRRTGRTGGTGTKNSSSTSWMMNSRWLNHRPRQRSSTQWRPRHSRSSLAACLAALWRLLVREWEPAQELAATTRVRRVRVPVAELLLAARQFRPTATFHLPIADPSDRSALPLPPEFSFA